MTRSKVEVEGIEGAWPLHCNSTTLELAYPNPNPTTNTFFVLFVKVRIKKIIASDKCSVAFLLVLGCEIRDLDMKFGSSGLASGKKQLLPTNWLSFWVSECLEVFKHMRKTS